MSKHTRRRDMGLGATANGGSAGSFASHERAGASAPPTSEIPAPPDIRDDVTIEELDAAVNFTERDQQIRELWRQGLPTSKQADELSSSLVRDTLSWRYADGSTAILDDDKQQGLMLVEVRDRHGRPLAASRSLGRIEDGSVDYSDVTDLDDELWTRLADHIELLPRTGKHAPKMIPPDKLRGVSEGYIGMHRLPFRPQGPSKQELEHALLPSTEDRERAADRVAADLMNDTGTAVKGMTPDEARQYVLNGGAPAGLSFEMQREAWASSVERMYLIGADHPLDNRIERDWADNRVDDGQASNPWSRVRQEQAIDRARELRHQLDAKTISPTKIIGSGYLNPRRSAYEYLARMDADARRALETRGRSLARSRFTDKELADAWGQMRDEVYGA